MKDYQSYLDQGIVYLEGSIYFNIIGAKNLKKMDITGHSDPYTEIVLDGNMIQDHMIKTDVIDNTGNPVWNKKADIHYKIKDSSKES